MAARRVVEGGRVEEAVVGVRVEEAGKVEEAEKAVAAETIM